MLLRSAHRNAGQRSSRQDLVHRSSAIQRVVDTAPPLAFAPSGRLGDVVAAAPKRVLTSLLDHVVVWNCATTRSTALPLRWFQIRPIDEATTGIFHGVHIDA